MQAIAVDEYGAEPRVMELPKPKPGPGQILIKILAAGMNPMDRLISDGEWKATMPGKFPLVLGADMAGVVEAVGENTTRFSSGDVVFGQLFMAPVGSTGTYAEYVAVREDANLARMPKKLDAVVGGRAADCGRDCAANRSVSWSGLPVGPYSSSAAGGGVGSFATQFAAQAGRSCRRQCAG